MEKGKKIINQSKVNQIKKAKYTANENKSMVVDKDQIKLNIEKEFELVDAQRRSKIFRFTTRTIRNNLKSGNIQGSKNVPFQLLINEIEHLKKKKN